MNLINIKENMGNVDRIIRATIAVIFVTAFYNGIISGPFGNISLAVAVIFLNTAIFGICPVYSLFAINTKWKHAGHR